MAAAVERDVQEMLMGQRRTKREQGNVPYPVSEYTTDLANLDIWDNMFFESIWGSQTIYNFPTPPGFVLDIGCGTGWWVMTMARRWTNSSFVGFDLAEIQPKLHDYDDFMDISDRIIWVNGNFLDVLPFPDDHFDYVRVCRAGLAIPEDEWQWVLEQLWRVMSPGGLLEVIEEDLIFPLPTLSAGHLPEISVTPSPAASKLESHPTLDTLSSISSNSTEPTITSPTTSTLDDRSSSSTTKLKSKRPRLSSFKSSPGLSHKDSAIDLQESKHRISTDSTCVSEGTSATANSNNTNANYYTNHPQNHLKLKAAWDSMLLGRFISAKVLSILPFYLSTLFSGLEIFNLYSVPLPTNTPLQHGVWDDDDDSLFSFPRPPRAQQMPPKPSTSVKVNPTHTVSYPISTELPRLQAMDLCDLAGMHLHYTVSFIKSCKDAIRKEYQRMFPVDECTKPSPRMQRSVGCDSMDTMFPHRKPDSFDVEWNDWVCDMEDRMRLRYRFPGQVSWAEPRAPRGGKPLWRHWRKAVDQLLAREGRSVFDNPPNPQDLCRTARAYMAWKGTKPTPVR